MNEEKVENIHVNRLQIFAEINITMNAIVIYMFSFATYFSSFTCPANA